MVRDNLTWIKGDIYFDHVHLDGNEVQLMCLSLIIKSVTGEARMRGLLVCVYDQLAELVCGHVRKQPPGRDRPLLPRWQDGFLGSTDLVINQCVNLNTFLV